MVVVFGFGVGCPGVDGRVWFEDHFHREERDLPRCFLSPLRGLFIPTHSAANDDWYFACECAFQSEAERLVPAAGVWVLLVPPRSAWRGQRGGLVATSVSF